MADTTTQSWKLLYEAGRQALQLRKFQEAEQSFSAALQLAEEFPAADPRLAATLNALARVYSLQRRYLAAAALLNRLLETTERTLGPRHAQVAGVLTNLAEMYTQLGQAPEELELRERVLEIRREDADVDPVALGRLVERVHELRALVASQAEAVAKARAEEEAAARARAEAEVAAAAAARAEREAQLAARAAKLADVAPARLSPVPATLATAPWPGATASTASATPASSWPGAASASQVMRPAGVPMSEEGRTPSPAGLELVADQSPYAVVPTAGTGSYAGVSRFGDGFGRWRGRPRLYSLAAAAVLVVGLAAARGFGASDDESDDSRISTGSVNLANTVAPAATPEAAPSQSSDVPLPRREQRVEVEERARAEMRLPEAERLDARDRVDARPPRVPSAAELDRALRAVDGAAKAIDRQTRAIADSATSVRVQGPTFRKVRISEP